MRFSQILVGFIILFFFFILFPASVFADTTPFRSASTVTKVRVRVTGKSSTPVFGLLLGLTSGKTSQSSCQYLLQTFGDCLRWRVTPSIHKLLSQM